MDDAIRIQYVDGAFGRPDAPYRELALRRYEGGAHTVTMSHPAQLHADVAAWLQ